MSGLTVHEGALECLRVGGGFCAAMLVSIIKGTPEPRSDWFSVPPSSRISLEDLSPSVVLHMTEKLGYKNSDVINTVLSNRACHILAIYFLLNKKLERYLSGVSGALCWFSLLSMNKKKPESSDTRSVSQWPTLDLSC